MAWCGVKLRLIVLVEGEGAVDVNDGVFVVRADDVEDAFRVALELGASQEQEYLNGDGNRVRWRFAEVLRIHWMGDSLEGCEVMYDLGIAPPPKLAFEAIFSPADSKPEST